MESALSTLSHSILTAFYAVVQLSLFCRGWKRGSERFHQWIRWHSFAGKLSVSLVKSVQPAFISKRWLILHTWCYLREAGKVHSTLYLPFIGSWNVIINNSTFYLNQWSLLVWLTLQRTNVLKVKKYIHLLSSLTGPRDPWEEKSAEGHREGEGKRRHPNYLCSFQIYSWVKTRGEEGKQRASGKIYLKYKTFETLSWSIAGSWVPRDFQGEGGSTGDWTEENLARNRTDKRTPPEEGQRHWLLSTFEVLKWLAIHSECHKVEDSWVIFCVLTQQKQLLSMKGSLWKSIPLW